MVLVTKMGPFGGNVGGRDMDTGVVDGIVRIIVHHGETINSVSILYERDGVEVWTDKWGGGIWGGRSEIRLSKGEYFTCVRGHVGEYNGRPSVVRSLTFVSNLRSCGPYGREEGIPFTLRGKVAGFHARYGEYLEAFGTYVLGSMTKMGPCGGIGGGGRDIDTSGLDRIVRVIVHHGLTIDSLSVLYQRNGVEEWADRWGGGGGGRTEIPLGPDEYFTSVKGHVGLYYGMVIIRSLTFVTNLHCYGPYGSEEGMAFALPGAGGRIVGFHGRSGDFLDALGTYVWIDGCVHHFDAEAGDPHPFI